MERPLRRTLGLGLCCLALVAAHAADCSAATGMFRLRERELAPHALKPPLEAHITALNSDYVAGWICAPATAPAEVPVLLDGAPLGTAQLAPSPASRCARGTASDFQFAFPNAIQDGQAHRVAVYARNARHVQLADDAERLHTFAPRAFTTLATQPDVDSSATEAAVLSGDGYRPAQAPYTLYSAAPYCLPSGASGSRTHGALARFTGLDGGLESAWTQSGRVVQGIHLVRDVAGSYIDNQGDAPADCYGLAGANVLFAWSLDAPDAAPAIWSAPGADKSRELVIGFDLDVPIASGTSYAGATVLFRTLRDSPRGDRFLFFDIQAFDTRATQPLQAAYGAGELPGADAAIVATAFAHSGAIDFGRVVAGDFAHRAGGGWTHYEFRLNGWQLERALAQVGCSDRDTTRLPCDASQLRFSLVALGMENVAPATLAADVGHFTVGFTQ